MTYHYHLNDLDPAWRARLKYVWHVLDEWYCAWEDWQWLWLGLPSAERGEK